MVNVEAGTKTQLSSLFSGFLLIAVILYFGRFLQPLPMASHIIVNTGFILLLVYFVRGRHRCFEGNATEVCGSSPSFSRFKNRLCKLMLLAEKFENTEHLGDELRVDRHH